MQHAHRALSAFLAFVLVFTCNSATFQPLAASAAEGSGTSPAPEAVAPAGTGQEGVDTPSLPDDPDAARAAGPGTPEGVEGDASREVRAPRDLSEDGHALGLALLGAAYRDAGGRETAVQPAEGMLDASGFDPRRHGGFELRYAVELRPGDLAAGDTFSVAVPPGLLAVDGEKLAEANGEASALVSYVEKDGAVTGTLSAEAAATEEPLALALRVPVDVRADALGEEPAHVGLALPGGASATLVLPAKAEEPAEEPAPDPAAAPAAPAAPAATFALADPLVDTTSVVLEKDWRDNNAVDRPWKAIAEDGTLAVWFTVAGGAKTRLDTTTMGELGLGELPRIAAAPSGTSRTTYTCEGLPRAVTANGASQAVAYVIEEDAGKALGHGYLQRVVDGALCNVEATAFTANVAVRDGGAGIVPSEDSFKLYRAGADGTYAPTADGTAAWDPAAGTYTVSDLPRYDDSGKEVLYRLEATGAAVNSEGDYLLVEYDNAAVANHGTDVDACYDGGVVNLTLAGETRYQATKTWLDPAGTLGSARPDATFFLWRYTQKAGNGFAQASQVRDDDGNLIVVPLAGDDKNAGSFPVTVDSLPKFDPEGYPYVYLMREELGASDPPYEQVFGEAVEDADGAVSFADTLPDGVTRVDADRSLYNGGTLSNRIAGSQTVEKKKTWKASAYQSDFSDAVVTLTLESRPKGAGDAAWKPTGATEQLSGFVAEIVTKTASASVSSYDELGRELEYRWVETSLVQQGGERLDPATGRFTLDCNASIDDPANEHRDVDWFVSKEEPIPNDPDGETWIVNRLDGEVDYAIDKVWRQLDAAGNPLSDADGNPLYGKTPPVPGASIAVAIYQNGVKMGGRTYAMDGTADEVNRETSPYHVYVDDLPKFDDEGRPYTYTAHEEAGYPGWYSDYAYDTANRRTDIKNDPTGPGNRIKVGKIWIDDSDVGHRYPVTVQLRKKNADGSAGEAVGGPVVLNAENGWWAWVGAPTGDYGDYVLEETAVTKPGGASYTPDASRGPLTVTTDQHIYLVTSGYDAQRGMLAVTNKRIGTIDLTVTKTWVDKGADKAQRPAAKLKLVCVEYPEAVKDDRIALPGGGELPLLDDMDRPASSVQTVSADAEAGAVASYYFHNLPKYDAEGRVVHYAVEEVGSDGTSPFGDADYRAFIDQTGYEVGDDAHSGDRQAVSVENRRVGTKSIEFHKRWVDEYAYGNGKRPDIYLTLWQKTASTPGAAEKVGADGFVSYHWKTREGANVDPSTDWTATIAGVSKYDDAGEEILYYAQESTNGDPSIFDYTAATYLDDALSPVSPGDGSDWALQPEAATTVLKEGGTFVNALERNVVIEGKKLWMNIPDGFPYAQMPSVEVSVDQLLGGVEVVHCIASTTKLAQVAGTNEFTFSIPKAGVDDPDGADLPKYDDAGRLYEYRVNETIIDMDPSGTTWGDLYAQSGTTLEFKNTFNTGAGNVGSLRVEKTWDRAGDTRAWPVVTFKLHRLYGKDGAGGTVDTVDEVVQTKTLASSADTGNVATFDDLLVYAPDGQRFRYYVEEEGIDGFTADITGVTFDDPTELSIGGSSTAYVENAYDRQGSVSLTGEKRWDDYGDAFGLRPGGGADIGLELRRTAPAQPGQHNAIAVAETVNAVPAWTNEGADVWTYAYTGLDRYAPNGMPWDYQVVEKPRLDGVYGATDKSAGAQSVDESSGDVTMKPLVNGFATQAKVQKTWEDDGDRYKLRPTSVSVKLQVSADGGATWSDAQAVLGSSLPGYAFSKTLSGPGWSGSFDNLPPKNEAGGATISYAYRVVESATHPSYDATASTANNATAITNALKGDGVSLTVTKTWNDGGNAFGTRPQHPTDPTKWQVGFTVQRALKTEAAVESAWADVVSTDSTILTETIEGGLSGSSPVTKTFDHLPKYDEHGNEYVYRAREASNAAPAYQAPAYAEPSVANVTGITNNLDTASVSGTKTWKDADASKRPSEVGLVLYRASDGFAKEAVPGDPQPTWSGRDTGTWTYAFAGLPERDRLGNPYSYTVEERPVAPGYWASYDASGRQVTNAQTAFKLDKVDAADGSKRVDDVELSVYRAGSESAGQELAVWARDASGTVSVRVTGSSMAVGAGNEILGLPQGDYVLRETKTPAAYVTADDIPFSVKSDGTVTSTTAGAVSGDLTNGIVVTMKDRLAKAQAVLTKSVTGGSGTVKGVEFNLYKQKGSVPAPATDELIEAGLTTDDSGKITRDDLGVGAYYFVETKATPDTVLDPEPLTFAVTNAHDFAKTGAPVQVSAANAAFNASLSLAKLDGTSNEALAGAAFELYYTPEGATASQPVSLTGSGSTFSATGLKKGAYTITEVTAPQGYSADAGALFAGTFTLTDADNGKTVVVKEGVAAPEVAVAKTAGTWTAGGVTNARILGSLTLTKVDASATGTKLEGAEFALTYPDGHTDSLATDASGVLSASDLPWGEYTIAETKAPEGYELGAAPYSETFTVGADNAAAGVNLGEVGNAKSQITVTKTSDDGATKIAGARLQLQGVFADGDRVKTWASSDTAPWDLEGMLAVGEEYTLTETGRLSNYLALPAEGVSFKLGDDGAVTITRNIALADGRPAASATGKALVLRNIAVKGGVQLTKFGPDGTTPLQGVTFDLYAAGGTTPLREDLATDANGVVKASDLPEGSYYFKETATLAGNVFDPAEQTFSIGPDQHGKTVSLTMSNAAFSTAVELTKVDGTDNKPLSGAQFTLSKDDGTGAFMPQGSAVGTNGNGAVGFALTEKGTYRIQETQAAPGYVLPADPYTATFTVENTDAFQGKKLELTQQGASAQAVKYKLTVDDVTYGKDGFVANERILGTAKLTKVDADASGQPLEGAQFALLDGEGSSLGTFETGMAYSAPDPATGAPTHDGTLSIEGLSWGSYAFQEVAAAGYQVPDTRYPFVIGRDGASAALSFDAGTVANKRTELAFDKLESSAESCSDPLLGAPAPDATQPLAGAVFTAYADEACTVAATTVDGVEAKATSDADGHVSFKHLPGGATYYVKETGVPAGHVGDGGVYRAVFGADGTLSSFVRSGSADAVTEIVNDVFRADISIKKVSELDESKTLPNSTYGLFKRVGAPAPAALARSVAAFSLAEAGTPLAGDLQLVAKAVTDEDGMLTFEGVLMNQEYVVQELVAPDGSLVSKNPIVMTFAIGNDGRPRLATFDDGSGTAEVDDDGNIVWKEPQVVVEFDKKDDAGAPLAGAKLQVVDEEGAVVVEPWTSAADKPHRVEGVLVAGATYRLVELAAPEGYLKADDVTFMVEDPKLGPGENHVQRVVMVDRRAPEPEAPTTTAPTATPPPKTPPLAGFFVKTGDSALAFAVAGMALAALGVAVAAGIRRRRTRP